MGLDSYVFQVSRPTLPERTYQFQELASKLIVITPQEQGETRYRGLLPFAQKVSVVSTYYDMERLQHAFEFDDKPQIFVFHSSGHIWVSGRKNGGQEKHQVYGPDYTFEKEERCFVCQQDELAYWRNAHEVQNFFYEQLGDIENAGYYQIPKETILAFNSVAPASWGRLPEMEPSEDQGLFYYEWY